MVRITKTLVSKLTEDPVIVLQSLSENEIASIIQKANHEYYTTDKPLFTDNTFDIIKDYLTNLNPNNPVLKTIGAAVSDNRKVKLPYFMGSLDKIKTETKVFDRWKNSYTCSYVVSDKLDGNSGLLCYKNGSVTLYTRGDGTEGQNVSHLLAYVKGIPPLKHLLDDVAVRGEFIISKHDFEKVKEKGANARNMVAGVLNAKLPDIETAQYVQFVAYELINPHVAPETQIEKLQNMHFKVVWNKVVSDKVLSLEKLSDILQERRTHSEYEIDGLVVMHNDNHPRTRDNPKYAFAFKNIHTMDRAEVIVSKVEWNISKDGYFRPVVLFNPVSLAGVTIQRATGFNGKFIYDGKIGPGSKIVVMRAGDVIPHIMKVVEQSSSGKPQMPDGDYEWTSSGIDIVVSNSNLSDPDSQEINDIIKKKNLVYFFDKIDIKGVSGATIGKLYDAGYTTVKSIFNLSRADLLKINGFKEKSSDKLIAALAERNNTLTCLEIMEASNTLGRGFGSKKLELITTKFPTIITKHYVPSIADLISIKGVEKKTAENFTANIPKFFKFVTDNGLFQCDVKEQQHKQLIKNKPEQQQTLQGMHIVFTGFRNKELESFVKDRGGAVSTSVSKKTTMVVAKDLSKASSKLASAEELQIPIVSLDDFKKQINFSD